MTASSARRIWFQIHKWIGLILMILLASISLSGSVLLAHDWLEEEEAGVVTPALPLPLSRYIAVARPLTPKGAAVSAVDLPTEDAPVVTVEAVTPLQGHAKPRLRQSVRLAFDPATARPVQAGDDDDFFEGTLHRFHGSLMLPFLGRPIVGWLGIAMFVSCISGIWLWWPSVGHWYRGLRWGRGRDWTFNLHHQVGFWIALPLAVLSFTGSWIAFPRFFSGLTGLGAPPQVLRRPGAPLPAPHLAIDDVVRRMTSLKGLRRITLPTADMPIWTGRAGEERSPGVLIDDATGRILPRPRQDPVILAVRAIHDGEEVTGPVWRLIAMAGGVAPTVLSVTGLIMWLRSRRWRADLPERRRSR